LISLFNKKADQWIKGRKNLFERISGEIGSSENIIWFHAASLGEFEQGRPVIEAFRQLNPTYKILLTFFSPSGFEVRKKYSGADFIYYLPLDTKKNARKFIRLVRPKIAIFIKYEFWFNYISELYRLQIPLFTISAIFREDQHFFKWYGGWFRKKLEKITYFFVQDQNSLELLKSIGINQVMRSGDTRFDRVFELSKRTTEFPIMDLFKTGKKILLLGSSWPPDEELIQKAIEDRNDLKIIIAPHEVHESRIASIESKFSHLNLIRYTKADENSVRLADILIIDTIGILSGLYHYCDIAFIGGGFGKGIHNILEAVTFGKPVIFGPNYQKFKEAIDLIRFEGAFSVKNSDELSAIINRLLNDSNFYKKSSETCVEFVIKNCGATGQILKKINEYLLK
jgi:3-deoxy-D-manno-octulosonic-acid transferase